MSYYETCMNAYIHVLIQKKIKNIRTYSEVNNASHLQFKRDKERRKSLPGFHRKESCEAIAQHM